MPWRRDLVEHVIEKRHAASRAARAGAVEVQRDADLRLERIAGDSRLAVQSRHGCVRVQAAAYRRWRAALPEMRSFSSGVPTVTRRQFGERRMSAVRRS